MSLFRKPSTKKIGLKVLVMGATGAGKSVFTLSFPKLFALDSEAGLALYEGDSVYGANLLGVANTQDFTELSDAIDEIGEMVEEEEGAVGTLSIDSETKFYQNLTDAALTVEEKKARQNGRDEMDSAISMRGWGRVKSVAQRLQNLKIDLSAKGVNVVSVAQIDDVKQKVGDQFVKIGEKPVMQKNSEYDYDIVIKLFTEDNGKGGRNYKGEILKDRTSVTKVGQIIDNPSYQVWASYVEGRTNGDKIKSNLSKDAGKALSALEKEDIEAQRPIQEKLKEVMTKSPAHQKRAIELIKEAGIKDPTKPTASEMKKLEEIVAELNKVA